MKKGYFSNVKEMVKLATREIELGGVFNFKYKDVQYYTANDIKDMKEIDDNTFEFKNKKYDIYFTEPNFEHHCVCCGKGLTHDDDIYWTTSYFCNELDREMTCSEECAKKIKEDSIRVAENNLNRLKYSKITKTKL